MEAFAAFVVGAGRELCLFAATIFLIGGISDILIDLYWACRWVARRLTVYRHHQRATVATLAPPKRPGRLAVFVPAWDEASVIGAMLERAANLWAGADVRIYVGTYPNDPATAAAARSISSPLVCVIVGGRPGKTTKADCLNTLWQAMLTDEQREGFRFKAVVLHDAEDLVDAHELRIFDTLIERFDLVQLPVVPLPHARANWGVPGHYLDEFADQHVKTMVAREAIGAAVPAAGVGCAFARDMLERVASGRLQGPFPHDSLTEDYELGLQIRQLGGRAAFVRMSAAPGCPVVAVHAHFPHRFTDAVKQKSRWIAGIALAGWDRLGWRGNAAERWMRLNDRRAAISAITLLSGYTGGFLYIAGWGATWAAGVAPPALPPLLARLLALSFVILEWRLVVRALLVGHVYGWRQALLSIPRMLMANVIAVFATARAVRLYIESRRTGAVDWDKTAHVFPAARTGVS